MKSCTTQARNSSYLKMGPQTDAHPKEMKGTFPPRAVIDEMSEPDRRRDATSPAPARGDQRRRDATHTPADQSSVERCVPRSSRPDALELTENQTPATGRDESRRRRKDEMRADAGDRTRSISPVRPKSPNLLSRREGPLFLTTRLLIGRNHRAIPWPPSIGQTHGRRGNSPPSGRSPEQRRLWLRPPPHLWPRA